MNKPTIVNVTMHPITMTNLESGEVYSVPPSSVVINARPVEESAGRHVSGVELVKTIFQSDPKSLEILAALETENPDAVIVGSLIAAQAYPGRVMAMVAAPGFERMPPGEKRMRDDKFTVF